MTATAINVAAALDDLASEAGVAGTETTVEAGHAVCDALERGGCFVTAPDTANPEECPVAIFLRRACGLGRLTDRFAACALVVTFENVALSHRLDGAGRVHELVPLPAAVASAVRLIGARKARGLVVRRVAA